MDWYSRYVVAWKMSNLEREGVRVSLDGIGRNSDNIFVERLWRAVKYEEAYLKAYSNVREARAGINDYFRFYSTPRPHQALGYRTPAEVFKGDSAPSNEPPTERKWSPNGALVDRGNPAGCQWRLKMSHFGR